MRVFINTGRRTGFVKSALVLGALVRDEGHVLQTSRECRREKASAFRDFSMLAVPTKAEIVRFIYFELRDLMWELIVFLCR